MMRIKLVGKALSVFNTLKIYVQSLFDKVYFIIHKYTYLLKIRTLGEYVF